jgi:predicted DNA-binding transcriptional regulator AlpA
LQPTTIATDPLLTAVQVAELMQITPQRLANMRWAGHGPPFVKIGHRSVRYRTSDVDAWIRRNRKVPG